MNEENQQAEEQTVSVEFEEQGGEVKVEAQDSEETGTIVRDSEDQDSELENYSDNVQKRINQLTAKRKQALEESEAAYNYANQMKAQNEELRKRLEDLDKGYISEYGSRVETQEVAAKRILKEAYDAGDTDKIAEANAALAQLAVEKERLRVQKARSEQQAQQPEQIQEPQKQQVQRVEELDPKLQSWMKQNPWFGTDRAMTYTAFEIHKDLTEKEGYDPNSDEYYAEVDKRIRVDFPHKFGNTETKQTTAPVQTVASANRSVKPGRKTVRLTSSQVAIAKKLGVPLEEYAKQLKNTEGA